MSWPKLRDDDHTMVCCWQLRSMRCLVTFEDSGEFRISPNLATEERSAFGVSEQLRINGLQSGHRKVMAYHRELYVMKND